ALSFKFFAMVSPHLYRSIYQTISQVYITFYLLYLIFLSNHQAPPANAPPGARDSAFLFSVVLPIIGPELRQLLLVLAVEAVFQGQALDVVGELVGQGGVELVLPVLPRPVLFLRQGREGAVIEIDIKPHLVVAVFAHDVDLAG